MTRSAVACGLAAVTLVLGSAAPPPSATQTPVPTLPGASPFPPELSRRLAAAVTSKGAAYAPLTRHRTAEGRPRYTNRLIFEPSPYLEQHAHNPVNWYAWGDEPFAEAARTKRPVLLSIGYSTCHWCHVMEEESFEDEEIAAYLNAHYVAIKVDREERPDLDAIYMAAVETLTGRGGWPMTVWLSADRRPFFAGTYFPPRDGARGAGPGFLTLLGKLAEAYAARPQELVARGEELAGELRARLERGGPGAAGDLAFLETAVARAAARYDAVHGGTLGAPKFPSALPVRLLLAQARRASEPRLAEMAKHTLEGLARGGIHDQLGGGFHRYATDPAWRVPHFEKMLYDNALLALAYLDGYQATGEGEFARIAGEILDYVRREMTAEDGTFYSATDADSPGPHGEREEGRFFTWTPGEIEAVLGPAEAGPVLAYYGVSVEGNFDGRNVLYVALAPDELARRLGRPEAELRGAVDAARARLYAMRATRPGPRRDDKILTSWNGLMIQAMARGGFVLDRAELVAAAERAAAAVLGGARRSGRLLRSTRGGRAGGEAYLDDYAFLIAGLVDLYEASGRARWLEEALALQELADALFRDRAGGGYFRTSDRHEPLLAREKPGHDGAEPSGNSVALLNLLRLYELTGDERYRARADGLLAAFGGALRVDPTSHAEMLLALGFRLDRPKQIAIVSPGARKEAEPLLAALRRKFFPSKVLAVVGAGELAEHARLVPWLRDKTPRAGRATAYVCERGLCQLPVTDAPGLLRGLDESPERR